MLQQSAKRPGTGWRHATPNLGATRLRDESGSVLPHASLSRKLGDAVPIDHVGLDARVRRLPGREVHVQFAASL
jgi:hypothetical protein